MKTKIKSLLSGLEVIGLLTILLVSICGNDANKSGSGEIK